MGRKTRVTKRRAEGWDDDSQDSQEEESGGAALTLDLSRLLAGGGGGAHDSTRSLYDVEEEDPDCKNDPIFSVDIRQYLVNYLREFCHQPYFSHFAPHLTQQEASTLQSLQAMPV